MEDLLRRSWEYLPAKPIYTQKEWRENELDAEVPYLQLSILFTLSVFLFERWLDNRQLSRFTSKNAKIPDSRIPHDIFHKSLEYGADKLAFSMFSGLLRLIEGFFLLYVGWLPYAWDLSEQTFEQRLGLLSPRSGALYRECLITTGFVLILLLQSTIVDTPFSLYFTFVVEQKHGFNKNTLGRFFKDMVLQLAVTTVILSPCVSIVIALARLGGRFWSFYVWGFLFVFQIIMTYVYPEFIAQLFNKYTPLEDGPLKTKIEELAAKVKFPLTKLFVVDGSIRSGHSNAYMYGFGKNKRIVLYDTLIGQVTSDEIEAILGHELGHWALSHTIQGFVIAQLYTGALFATFNFVSKSKPLFAAFGFSSTAAPIFIALTLFTSTYWTPVDKILTFLVNANTRRNEFAADAYSKDLGYSKHLAAGLIKLQIENKGNMVPDPLYSVYHFSHPPLVERLGPLESETKKIK